MESTGKYWIPIFNYLENASICFLLTLNMLKPLKVTEVELYVRIKPYLNYVELISELPGITDLSATLILAEIGVDISVFKSAKHISSWAGLSHANNESAGKKGTLLCYQI